MSKPNAIMQEQGCTEQQAEWFRMGRQMAANTGLGFPTYVMYYEEKFESAEHEEWFRKGFNEFGMGMAEAKVYEPA